MELHAQIACSMPRDPRMIAAGWQARAVYTEAILYCRENLTDGVIDRLAMPFWMPDMNPRTRVKHLDRLVELGALDPCEQGWKFPDHVWRRWNLFGFWGGTGQRERQHIRNRTLRVVS